MKVKCKRGQVLLLTILLLALVGCGEGSSAKSHEKLNGDWIVTRRNGNYFCDSQIRLTDGEGTEVMTSHGTSTTARIKVTEESRKSVKLHFLVEPVRPGELGLYIQYNFNDDGTITAEYPGEDMLLTRKP